MVIINQKLKLFIRPAGSEQLIMALHLIEQVSMRGSLIRGQGGFQDTLQVRPCKLDGRIPAANGLEKSPWASSYCKVFSSGMAQASLSTRTMPVKMVSPSPGVPAVPAFRDEVVERSWMDLQRSLAWGPPGQRIHPGYAQFTAHLLRCQGWPCNESG